MKNSERYVMANYGLTGLGVWYSFDGYNDQDLVYQVKDIKETMAYYDNITMKNFPRVCSLSNPLYSMLVKL